MLCSRGFTNKSNFTRHVKNTHGAKGEKDVCGKAVSVDAFEKISLAEKDNKEAVLNNASLSDEQKVILYNEIFKKDLFKKK